MPADDFLPFWDPFAALPAQPGLKGFLEWLDGSQEFADLGFFYRTQPHTLLSPRSRALLYALVRYRRPETALEIGTYFAGASEVVARALHANGAGQLLTIDPFGGQRVPPILEAWPAELKARVGFMAASSMNAFMVLDERRTALDFAFIDGNHDYAYAAFDLEAAANRLAPGGLVVLDDYDQPGVFWAAKDFLARNPHWHDPAGVLAGGEPAPSVPETGFVILQGPAEDSVGVRPFNRMLRIAAAAVPSLDLACAAPVGGMLRAQGFLRVFYRGRDAVQHAATAAARVEAGDDRVALRFGADLAEPPAADETRRTLEVFLRFHADDGRARLILRGWPPL